MTETSFDDIIGQSAACGILLSALRGGRVPHAYLFVGPESVGKRAVGLRWAKLLNCQRPVSPVKACDACPACRKIDAFNHPDVLWVNFEYQARLLDEPVEKQRVLKIKTLREMSMAFRLKPLEGKAKVAFIEPADRLFHEAAPALLKILEEPPPQTHLVLLAQDPAQLLDTIRSRCQWVRFRPLPVDALAGFLRARAPGLSEDDARTAALAAEGSLARALAVLEKAEELEFDWEAAPPSELLAWCEQLGRLGREASDDFLRRLLARSQADLQAGRGSAETARRALEALHQLRQNVPPTLVLEVLLLNLRRRQRRAAAAS